MDNSRLISFSIICLAISLIISSAIISRALVNASGNLSSGIGNCGSSISGGLAASRAAVTTLPEDNDFLSLYDATVYLHIDETSLRSLVSSPDSAIPYTILGNNIIFSKRDLSKWMEDRISKGKDK